MASLDGTDRMIIDGKMAWYHKSGEIICMNRVEYTDKTYEKSKLLNEKKGLQKNLKKMAADKKAAAAARIKEIDSRVSVLSGEISKTTVWKAEAALPISFIKSGDHLICGMDNKVTVIDSKSGKTVKNYEVTGKVYGIATWNGNLVVSTGVGHIYCFGR